jgi:uncharacterized protein
MHKPLCIYHSPCADGFGAAWVVYQSQFGIVDFAPMNYGQPLTVDVTDRSVIFVDFSLKADAMQEVLNKAKSVLIIDHHKTAEADLSNLLGYNFETVFDKNHSGAVLAWKHFYPDKEPPLLLRYIEDRDLWRFDLPHSRDMSAFVFSMPYDFETWTSMVEACENADEWNLMVQQGGAINRKFDKDLNELLPQVTRFMRIGGNLVPVANLPYTMASEGAGRLAKGAPFAASYYDSVEGRRFSLRSTDEGLDVSEIAKAYGGGGHRNAAGFQARLGWEGDAA